MSNLSHSILDNKNAVASSDDDGDRIIDGLRYPRAERDVDQFGFETTKHALHFRGADWDIPLTQRRDELTKRFKEDAAAATGEPPENIGHLRFIVTDNYLNVRFTVRHKAHVTKEEVQRCLSKHRWREVKALYGPRQKVARKAPRMVRESTTTYAAPANINEYGRVNVGPNGPEFHPGSDADEEPPQYEQQVEAKRQNSMLRGIGIRPGA